MPRSERISVYWEGATLSHQRSLDCWVSLYLFSRRVVEKRYSSYKRKDFWSFIALPNLHWHFYFLGLTQFEGDTLQFTHRWRGLKPRQQGCGVSRIFIEEGEITETPLLQSIPSLFGAMSAVQIKNLGVGRV